VRRSLDADAVVRDVLVDLGADGLAAGDDRVQPPSARICLVEKLVWQPAPFQSPRMGLASRRGDDAEVLGDAEEQPTGRPELVADLERDGRMPIWNSHWRHHHLGVGALD
jgi:hypothetical protein